MFLCRTQSCLQTAQRSCCRAVTVQHTCCCINWCFRINDDDDYDRQSNVFTVAYSCLVFTNSLSLMLRLCVYKYWCTLHILQPEWIKSMWSITSSLSLMLRHCVYKCACTWHSFATGMKLCDLLETVSSILRHYKYCIASHSFEIMNVLYVKA